MDSKIMETLGYKKTDFLQTGSGEIAPIYLRSSAVGASFSIRGPLFFYFSKGAGYAYAWKKGVEQMKDVMLTESHEKLEAEFLAWKEKWDTCDEELFKMATTVPTDLQKTWQRLDEISRDIWVEAYKVEALDNFAEEIENLLLSKLKNSDIEASILTGIIAPAVYMLNQHAAQDCKKVVSKEISVEEYLRKYWFLGGTWAGGELIDKQMLEKSLQDLPAEIDFEKRKAAHALAEKRLEKAELNIIKVLRLLTLWREERKAQVQKYCLGYKKLVETIADKYKISHQIVEWSLREELDQLVQKQQKSLKRHEKSVFLFSEKFENGAFLAEEQIAEIFEEFAGAEKTQEVKGTVACRGLVTGRVKVIVKKEEFAKFSKGDILVTTMTRPEFLSVMRLASAIVTDEGGLTCHAAILSRELGIPCIVGTKAPHKINFSKYYG